MTIPNRSYQPVQSLTVNAAEDIPAFRFVSHLGTLCAAESRSLGVSDSDWLTGENASVITLGTAAVETSTSVNLGDDVTSDASGKAKTASGEMPVNGRALDQATGPGYIRIKLVP